MIKKFLHIALVLSFIFTMPTAVSNTYAAAPKKLNVYYVNWATYGDVHQKQQVRDLPWDRISTINHAFWRIEPNDNFTAFPIASTDEEADLKEDGCFDQYAEMVKKYPDVKVLLSIGGWNDTKWFSLMASSPKNRKTFVDSCVETIKEYPFLGGIDIDWEYPGTSRNNEGEAFKGRSQDKNNFTALMRELREAFDKEGWDDKILTYCAPVANWALRNGQINIDFKAIDPYVDRVNVMTYDMAGGWSRKGMHHSALHPSSGVEGGISVSESVKFIIAKGVPPEKINIGSPLYSVGWIINAKNGADALGESASGTKAKGSLAAGQFNWYELLAFENNPAWEVLYDSKAEAAYMYNNDSKSEYFQHFLSYENERSLQAKLDYINKNKLGGMIVWATTGDAMNDLGDFPMITQMAEELGLFNPKK